MARKTVFVVFFVFLLVLCASGHPTMYKLNENRKLEPDLVPVSSTVIPIPVYRTSFGIDVAPSKNEKFILRPDGTLALITANSTKKVVPTEKPKSTTKKNNN